MPFATEGLQPGTEQRAGPLTVRTLRRPPGERLATVATVNDLHFGETACGVIAGLDLGPVLHAESGRAAVPAVMNQAAVAEIDAIAPDAVVAKGDLTSSGTAEQYEQFLATYGSAFGDRLAVHPRQPRQPGRGRLRPRRRAVVLPGVTLAVLDTSRPGQVGGRRG